MTWLVRTAKSTDETQVLELIRLFVAEFRGKPDVQLPKSAVAVFHKLVSQSIPGTVLVAETAEGKVIGCATISVQEVIYKGGPYALLQELWVHPSYRSQSVGNRLIRAVEEYCQEQSIKRLEVCLPEESFITFNKTQNFYLRQGFEGVGPYMAKKVEGI
ncbi:hypothetical protein GCM10008967_32300 [Bacillus carboniphilus]|uniref:N-acetyltransferase domain-containing protein n=1 Tax=Bacillus carboniphilus TaxID=86663 RepID=A0ABN0WJQ2_9BACI